MEDGVKYKCDYRPGFVEATEGLTTDRCPLSGRFCLPIPKRCKTDLERAKVMSLCCPRFSNFKSSRIENHAVAIMESAYLTRDSLFVRIHCPESQGFRFPHEPWQMSSSASGADRLRSNRVCGYLRGPCLNIVKIWRDPAMFVRGRGSQVRGRSHDVWDRDRRFLYNMSILV